MVRGYLRDRKVIVRYAREESGKGTSKGCTQDSIASPTFWNFILDSLLRELGVYIQAFADDVVLVFSRQSVSSIEEEANRALARVHYRGIRNKLRFTPSKTNSMVLTKKLKYDDPVVHMNGEQISLVGEIRLLGLTIDRKLTFIPHDAKTCKKAINIYKGLARAANVTWGLSLEVAPATEKLDVRKMFEPVQHIVAFKACRAHRTVSLHSALILLRLLPLDIRELERPVYFGDLPYPAHVPENGYESVEDLDSQTMDSLALVGSYIYTDGSRIEDKVGAALTVRKKPGIDGPRSYHPLAHEAKCDISEIVAEGRTVRLFWVSAHAEIVGNERADEIARQAALTKKTAAGYDRIPLSKTKKVIRAASLEDWQQGYTEKSMSEITKCFFLRVEQAYRFLRKIEITSQVAQTLTGHGRLAQYLYRFKLRDSPYCACDPAKIYDVLHVLENCDIFHSERVALEAGIDVRIARLDFPEIL
ncbi:Retrovirus-related Pol polyprotein from type-1 retrotransposable element R1 [Eumeta japonica]|uniref:Retrovirus-related Pol polyprotein from type-1 retrotransposable element R1 n=1 Tax=Eumeta variegata TaxID=151549 RepID=A0A4C1TA44_EUMVA|nr:Retrovirus-related Pol polyprotein from type-1 retrotransposable element R1 [Eumeta japonica]